ncbi:TonB-dependent receptor plug domain-containing protein [Dyadobacter psychrotolerans]|uniref:TonB-dependent receptor n=1 Tax=Dyadobacter psychrotolerans TaxID=2541721 RepID=A0A4R5DIE0_9BACT|nr:TonB-dependent receptor [Dyadobacter psychrotolerans]TDE13679.1 TonB-dependent receptor [Dyadobacter psychrotolerans]
MAQKDTILLAPVTVTAVSPERFMSGLKLQKVDSATLSNFRFQNLGDLLMFNTPIAIKNYGPGQLSTASFRGTSANHTAVLWNGLNINSASLGQTDFSTIPVIGFDQLAVQYGSAASIVGSDAVGGSILLNSIAQPAGFNSHVSQRYGSFRNYQLQTGAKYGFRLNDNWNFSGKTALNYNRMINHFSSTERRRYALLSSQTIQQGLVQDFFFRSKNQQEFSVHIWLTKNKLTLSPKEIAGRELTLTEAYRTMIRYQFKGWSVRSSWVRDVIDFATGNYSNLDHAVTDRFSGRVEKDLFWKMNSFGNIQIKTGAEWANYRAQLTGYEKPLVTENRADLFALTRWQVTPALIMSVNLRQAFITKYSPPITPSVGAEYCLIKNEGYDLKIKGSYARSYRVPTLNERYWKTLGNPDIRPENGWNKEVGAEQKFVLNENFFTAGVTAYRNRIKNWTYWNPSKNYHVENLQEVLTRGVEIQAGWMRNSGILKSGANLGYTLNRSSQEKAYDNYAAEIVGKQLVFVPKHSGNLNAFVQVGNTRLTSQIQAVGKRFTTFDNSQFFNGYLLTNLLAENSWSLGKIQVNIQGQINNITNAFYLNVRNNAMPGRSYAINVTLSSVDFKTDKK